MQSTKPKAVAGRPFLSIWRYNLPYWRAYTAGAFLAIVFTGLGLGVPLVVKLIVDRLQAGEMTTGHLLGAFGLLVLIALATGVARFYHRILMIGASRRFEYQLRNDYFRHVQRQSQSFFNRTKTGDIMARATNDLNFARAFIGPGVMGTVDMVRLPFTLGFMVYLSPVLTLWALLPLPFLSLMVYGFVMYMHRQSKRVQEQFSNVTAFAQENLAGARVVKAYGIEDRQTGRFHKESEKYMWENMRLSFIMALAWPVIGVSVGATILIVIWQGGLMAINGQLSLGDLTAFIFCIGLLAWPLAEFGWVLTLYQRGAVGMNRINEILTAPPEIADGEQTRSDITDITGAIRFNSAAFSYADEEPALNGVSFDVAPGQTMAITGPTGAGKSTLVSLITRQHEATRGHVYIDGHDIRTIPLQVLRGAIGYVPQDAFVFSDTVRANLAFGRPDASQSELEHACDTAQLLETIRELPEGFDTLLGERGVNLSGGQKQRLTIARALLRQPRILILDDSLSSVDTRTEEEILTRLKLHAAGITTVLISHRISTVQHADLILVLENGRIAEQGRHASLAAQGGLYAAMQQRQLLEAELEDGEGEPRS